MTPGRLASRPLAVSPGEAARLAGIGRTRLYEAITKGELPSLKLGSRRLIRLADLEVWLESFAVVAACEARQQSSEDGH